MITPRQLKQGMLLCLMAGCATQPASTGTNPVPTGPRALLQASYTGGLLDRQTEAVFKVEEGAYAMVAHLGGDGRLTVLYPSDARETGRVPGGKWFRTQSVSAYYDAAPQLYSFAMNTYRTPGAQLDSYDGRGYGFIFLIASKRPLRFELISDVGLWNDLGPRDYRSTIDPRIAIKELADALTGGNVYTLKFARSINTAAMTSYADLMFDCAMLSQYQYSPFFAALTYPIGYFNALSMPGAYGGCRRSLTTYAYAPTFRFTPRETTTPTVPTPRDNPLRRPPHRRLGEPRPGLAFANPTRRNSPENPAPAPRDWSSILRNGDYWPQPGLGNRVAPRIGSSSPGRSAGSASGARSAPSSHPVDRTPSARPASTPTKTGGKTQQ